MDDTTLQALAERILQAQPFSQLLGLHQITLREGYAELRLELNPDHLQQHGFVHGGVLSYLADNSLTFAGGSLLGDALTAEYKINYLRPAQGTHLRAVAQVLHAGKRQAVCSAQVLCAADAQDTTSDHEQLVAVAQGTIVALLRPELSHAS